MRKASEPNVRALLMGFTMYSWSQRFGYSMDGVVGKTNQDVTRKLAQNNCLSLDSSPRLGTILGILSLRGALKKKDLGRIERSEEHTSELQSLMRISYAVFCL